MIPPALALHGLAADDETRRRLLTGLPARANPARAPTIKRLAAARADPEDAFGDVYAPDLLGFWLDPGHIQELRELALGRSPSRIGEYLAYEWAHLRGGRTLAERLCPRCTQWCICHHIERRGYPESAAGGGGPGDARGRSARIVADLEQGLDCLPIRWRTTRMLYLRLGRGEHWRILFEAYQRGLTAATRPQDGEAEPAEPFRAALDRLARRLGWRSHAERAIEGDGTGGLVA